jgi:hypothetical protein
MAAEPCLVRRGDRNIIDINVDAEALDCFAGCGRGEQFMTGRYPANFVPRDCHWVSRMEWQGRGRDGQERQNGDDVELKMFHGEPRIRPAAIPLRAGCDTSPERHNR